MNCYQCNLYPYSGIMPLDCQSPFADLSISRAKVISPNYPSNYENYLNCQLTINVALDKRVLLVFDEFKLVSSSSCNIGTDYLEVRNGNSTGFGLIGTSLCGNSLPERILSTGPSVTLKFKTNFNITNKGFKLTAIGVGKQYHKI